MNKRYLFSLTFLFLSLYHINSYGLNKDLYRHHKKLAGSGERTSLADPVEGNYDVKYLNFKLNLSDTSLFVRGDVATTAQVTAFSMSSYVFELDTLMSIDSAKVNGVLLPVFSSGASVRTIILPLALVSGAIFTAEIFYHGYPPPGGGFFNGLTHAVSSGGTNMVYSISDPYVAQVWWPCKQSLDDKIDSVDMFVTVPSGVYDGSNGVLLNIDSTSTSGYWQFHWQTHYAIEYYLISVAVARYGMFESFLHFTGSTDSMLIQNFFMDTATFDPLYKSNFDSIGMIINYFSSLFGRYPFWHEKYGACYTSLPGGMEHQTMTTIGVPYTWVIAHELCHQWFGDNVSFADWHDVWLSEGFATYAQTLFFTQFNGAASGLAHRRSYLLSALVPCGCTYVHDTLTADSLFYQPNVYYKGQAIIHMLRYLAPSDSVFFNFLQTYQQTYGQSVANTAQFQSLAESIYGFRLDTFFNQWIYGRGYPKVNVSWDQVGSMVYLRIMQTPSCPSATPLFSTYFEIELTSSTGADTILKLYDNQDTEYYAVNWLPTVNTVLLNPDAWTLCQQNGAITHNSTLLTPTIPVTEPEIFPNPTDNSWTINKIIAGISLTLTDINGKEVWRGISNSSVTIIPAQNLPSGDYFLKLNDNSEHAYQLTHR